VGAGRPRAGRGRVRATRAIAGPRRSEGAALGWAARQAALGRHGRTPTGLAWQAAGWELDRLAWAQEGGGEERGRGGWGGPTEWAREGERGLISFSFSFSFSFSIISV
jgi:hypothetical protein